MSKIHSSRFLLYLLFYFSNFEYDSTGFLPVLESPWIFFRFSKPGKSLKTDKVLESPRVCAKKVLEVA